MGFAYNKILNQAMSEINPYYDQNVILRFGIIWYLCNKLKKINSGISDNIINKDSKMRDFIQMKPILFKKFDYIDTLVSILSEKIVLSQIEFVHPGYRKAVLFGAYKIFIDKINFNNPNIVEQFSDQVGFLSGFLLKYKIIDAEDISDIILEISQLKVDINEIIK